MEEKDNGKAEFIIDKDSTIEFMKKIYTILVCVWLLAGFVACEKDKDFALTTLTVQNETITPSYGSATIDCSFKSDATISEAFVQYSLLSSFAKYDVAKMTEEKGKYAAQLTGLADNTTYYIRYTVSNKYSSVVTEEVIEFQTLQCTVPTIVLDSIADVWENRAKAYIHLAFDGGASVTDMGICWGTQANPTIEDIHKSTKDTVAVLDIPSLQPNTQYYVRAYAVNKVGVSYSEEQVFATYALPEVRTEEVTDIRLNSAQLTATLLFDGNDNIIVKGFCWSTTQDPTISDSHIIVESESANYTCLIADLLAETQYYVRAFAQNKIGVAYGEEKSFKTQKTLPILTTSDVTEITETSVTIRGYVISDGGSEIIERGVVYNTSQSPTIDDNKITAGSGNGEFYCKLEDLQKGVVYYVRAYAVNEIGIAYGAERSFMTDIPLTPADGTENGYGYVDLGLSVKWATMNVGATKPEEYGNYYAWGEIEIKDTYSWYFYKYCEGTSYSLTKYNTSAYDETKDDKITLETMDDVASVNWGGSWRMPTEKEIAELREKCTCSWTGINGVLGYKITSKSNGKSIFLPAAGFRDNSSLISAAEYGYYWSSSLNTDISSYARYLCFSSYSINVINEDRCYGLSIRSVCDEVTVQAQKPTITTTIVTQITETTAVAGGNVTSDGGESVTERGVVYSTKPNPVITNLSNTIRPCGSGTGVFTYTIYGLQSGTTYYVRAYAKNDVGTAYGEELSFTTKEQSSIPSNGTENGYAYVDLGLSVKWATMNVGASKAEEYGDYFAWGEIEPKDYYDWGTYKWCNGSANTLTKYNTSSSYGTVDNKTQLDLIDDAAYMNWGGKWRMPTDAELTELREQCTWTWTTQNEVNGYKVTSKSNGNSIFLPAAGYRFASSLHRAGSHGYYLSSLLSTDYSYGVCYVSFDCSNMAMGNGYRFNGLPLRPVCQ